MFVELHLRKTKWLLYGCYHPPSESDNYFFYHIKNDQDKSSQKYNNYVLIGDFSAEVSEASLSNLLFEIDAKNIVNNYACYTSVENPSCIYVFITNSTLNFQNTVTITTGLFDFNKMVITVLKTAFAKLFLTKS